jgi:hypothetical protein
MSYSTGQENGQPFIECGFCGMRSFNSNDIEQRYCGNCHRFHLGHGAYLEPDPEPRGSSPFHRRILRSERIPNTRTGQQVVLECGHTVQTFGRI